MIHTNITNIQKEILLLLYRFRFLNRLHIQTLLHHKNYTRTNRLLKDLAEKKYISKIFKRSWTENPVPAKYYIALNGIRYLKNQPDCKNEYLQKLYREKDRSGKFISKCLFIADIYLQFLKHYESSETHYQFSTQQDYTPASIVTDIMPDFLVIKSNAETKLFNLFQLFPEGTPRFAVRKRIEQYVAFLTEEDGTQINAQLHLVAETEALYTYLVRHVKRVLEDESISTPIRVASYDQIREHGLQLDIMEQADDTED